MKKKLSLLVVVLVLLLGCADKKDMSGEYDNHQQQHVANGDLQEKTKSVTILPSFLHKKEELQQVYLAVGQSPELLENIPCYCGCGETANHKSSVNCFIKEYKIADAIVWDDHGTRCDVCVNIAVEAINLQQEGKAVKEIRTIIDEKYKEGFAAPTPTKNPI
ncbi:PCYCGC motif-containing (lipo)protein [Kurthia sibirica]|uniref:Lipoprotein n=1 Tax=Kurthia sibirica TaxID=202750 RepID=A0A2U3AQB0_9BACL|nr:PCYCGC motif-containing (lipo)protein [Kurthia sibirica]PWI26714.1 hypothetical protein DEX24_02620 [Kurthia sibirica]GEK32937.1 hypothetical protein KSI01_04700 [Kurthia sibirica]